MKKFTQKTLRLVFPIFVFIIMTSFFYVFRIQTIEVRGTKNIVGLSQIDNTFIFLLNEKQLTKKLLSQNFNLESISLLKKYPNTILLTAVESKILASLLVDTGYYDLTKNARIVGKHHEIKKGKTIIKTGQLYPYSAYQVGDTISNPPLSTSLYLLFRLDEIDLPIDTIEVKGFDVLVFTKGDKKYLFLAEENRDEQYNKLLAVIRGLSLQGKKYTSIDVRFNKPVVKLVN